MQEDFIEDDYLEEESSGGNRPFLIAVGALVTVFVLAGACTLAFLLSGQEGANNEAEVAAIETRNAEIAVTNTAVAIFISETETAQALPTNTPEPTVAPTDTPTPAPDTPTPTDTPVVDAEAEIVGEENGEEAAGDETPEADETVGTVTAAVTTAAGIVGDSTPTPISALATEGDGDTLPQTGLDTWGIVLFALGFVFVFVLARRLRTG